MKTSHALWAALTLLLSATQAAATCEVQITGFNYNPVTYDMTMSIQAVSSQADGRCLAQPDAITTLNGSTWYNPIYWNQGCDQTATSVTCNTTFNWNWNCPAASDGQITIGVSASCSKFNPAFGCEPDPALGHPERTATIDHSWKIDKAESRPTVFNGVMYRWVLWDFQVPVGSGGAAYLTWLPNLASNSTVTHEIYAPGQADAPPEADYAVIEAQGCGHVWDRKVVALNDDDCNSCPIGGGHPWVGNPVNVGSGTVKVDETLPLPLGVPGVATIEHDSRKGRVGYFGRGWTSALDAWVRRSTNGYLTLRAPSGRSYVFYGDDGMGYVQLFPREQQAVSFRYDSSRGYVLREVGSTTEFALDATDGHLLSATDLTSGRSLTVQYTSGIPSRLVDSWGALTWTLTTLGGVITRADLDASSTAWQFGYDSQSNLTQIADATNNLWRSYTYASRGGIADVKDASGNVLEHHDYDADGRATSSFGPAGEFHSISYNWGRNVVSGQIVATVATNGSTSTYTMESRGGRTRVVEVLGGCSGCGSKDAVYGIDSDGRMLREQDARGYLTVRTYDSMGRLATLQSAMRRADCDPAVTSTCRLTSGTILSATLVATPESTTTTYTYDSVWADRVAIATTVSVTGSPRQRVDRTFYDAATGRVILTQREGWTGVTPVQETRATSTALYGLSEPAAFTPGGTFNSSWASLAQPAGLPKVTDGPRTDVSDVTTYVYYPVDAAVPAPLRGRLAAVRNAVGHITHFEDYDAFGTPRRAIDANGALQDRTTDILGRTVTQILRGVPGCNTTDDPLCATDLVTSSAAVPPLGPFTTQTSASGAVTVTTYDGRARVHTISRGPGASNLREQLEYSYDPVSGKKSMQRTLGKENGAFVEKTRESFAYDGDGRLSTVTHADNATVVTAYDANGNVASVKDERHSVPNTVYVYDPLGRLKTVKQLLGAGWIETAYSYDSDGNLQSVTDPNGNVTTYVTDDFGQVRKQTSPVTGVTTYSFDAAGNLIDSTDANQCSASRSYDALNRVTAATYDGSDPEHLSWTYDDVTAGTFGVGRLTSDSSDFNSRVLAYDRRGLLREEALSINGDPATQRYGYDAEGRRSSIEYPSGRVVQYTFDFAGRPLTATGTYQGTPTSYVTGASYLPFGPITSLTVGNGTAETRTYTNRYLPETSMLTGASTIASYSYSEDAAGNITQITDTIDATYSRSFGYDDLNRLITANSGTSLWGTGGYTYDGLGNVLTSTLGAKSRSWTYVGTTPLISETTLNGVTSAISYDGAGNELNGPTDGSSPSDSRSYTARNLLRSVSSGQRVCLRYRRFSSICETWGWLGAHSEISNDFDARGVRVSVSTNLTDPTEYFYTPELSHLAEKGADGERDVVWFDTRPVAIHDAAALRFLHTDHLGTPFLATDSAGAVTWRVEYEPYGNVAAVREGSSTDVALRFPGQRVAFVNSAGDEENYNIFRWYRSGWGRYTQADPFALMDGPNLFSYVANDPVDGIDPLGLVRIYGNWCGPEWTGGWERPWNDLTRGQRARLAAPIDALDRACQLHDMCYAGCGNEFRCNATARSSCFRGCDVALTVRGQQIGGLAARTIAAVIDRPGRRPPGPNAADCCSPPPPQPPSVPSGPNSPRNCVSIGNRTICAATGM